MGMIFGWMMRRFSNLASSEDWLALMTAIERSDDPARTTLERMLRWSLLQDAKTASNAATSIRDTTTIGRNENIRIGGSNGGCADRPRQDHWLSRRR